MFGFPFDHAEYFYCCSQNKGCVWFFLQMIFDAIEQVGGIYVVTNDHGNAEDMVKRNKKGEPLLDKDGNIQILTSHTLQPVSELNFPVIHHRVKGG